MTIRSLAHAGVIALALAGSGTVLAQTTSGETTAAPAQPAGPAWSVTCASAADLSRLQCSAFQELRVQQSGQRLVRVQITMPGGDSTPVFAMSLPHGINFVEGAKVTIDDGQPRTFAIRSADQSGSYTQVPFDAELAAAMKAGNEAKLRVRLLNGRDLEIGVSLNGFTKAVDLAAKGAS
jgi:invasion protein IalB